MEAGNKHLKQKIFYGIGDAGQQRLSESRVCIIGIGATGTRVAAELARAVVGFIRLVDQNTVDHDNIQRQVLFTVADAE